MYIVKYIYNTVNRKDNHTEGQYGLVTLLINVTEV